MLFLLVQSPSGFLNVKSELIGRTLARLGFQMTTVFCRRTAPSVRIQGHLPEEFENLRRDKHSEAPTWFVPPGRPIETSSEVSDIPSVLYGHMMQEDK